MATLDDLKGLGYEVGLSFEGADFSVHRVEGFGLSTQVREDDGETIQSIADGHEEAVKQQDETTAETQLRWAADPDNPYELDDEARAALEGQVQQEEQA
jgi:hypothetical protein